MNKNCEYVNTIHIYAKKVMKIQIILCIINL